MSVAPPGPPRAAARSTAESPLVRADDATRAVVFAYSNVGDRCLRVLHAAGVEVALVVTHRDAPGETIWFRRVADTAAELGLRCLCSDGPADGALGASVEQARPDIVFSFYYRALLPMPWLAQARLGAFNMHGSLLPKYRGRAPTNWAVLNGERETGATLHEMVARADAGAIVDQSAVPILPDDTAREVFDKVTVAAEQVLWRSLPALLEGRAPRLPNPIGEGSCFPGRKPEDGRIDWRQPAEHVYNLIRAVAPPYPGAFTDLGGRRLVVASARRGVAKAPGDRSPREPGLAVESGCIVGICGDGGVIDVKSLWADGEPVTAARLVSILHADKPVLST